MLKSVNPAETASWKKLKSHYGKMRNARIRKLFDEDKERFSRFSLSLGDLLVDYSKNIITRETVGLLTALAEETGLRDAIEAMFNGECINVTENRPVLHTALRNISGEPVYAQGRDIMPQIRSTLERMEDFSRQVIEGRWRGYTDKAVRSVVNIGIGGSHLGAAMATEALRPYSNELSLHFVSNIDATDISETLKGLNPETTLFLIASKTFTTQETMTNAKTAREWFLAKAKKEEYIKRHFIAISANAERAAEFGIAAENVFMFWDWVGGRYSLWSAIGLSVACAVGFDNYSRMLEGAYDMDSHFRSAPFEKNIPVMLALIGIWYNNFFGASSEAVLPYDEYLKYLPAYLQQANMESNGKYVGRNGAEVDYHTGPVIWGQPGTNGQHAFFQLLHQGTRIVPCDFIAPFKSHNPVGEHHSMLISNFLAQTEALMNGRTADEVRSELKASGMSADAIKRLAPYKVFKGNRPTNTIVFDKLTPRLLGALIAMYEHKIFVQGVIWNITSFDQWGVELGKKLAGAVLGEIKEGKEVSGHDSSTNGLVNRFIRIGAKGL